jgi:hypothetical protein
VLNGGTITPLVAGQDNPDRIGGAEEFVIVVNDVCGLNEDQSPRLFLWRAFQV